MCSNMKTDSAVLVVLVASLLGVTLATSTTYATCDSSVISSIKAENNGSFPVSFLTSIKVIWNSDYSIVWYSDYMVQKDNLTCVTTKFGYFECVNSYVNHCKVTKEVKFKTSFNLLESTFSITEYEGMALSAYPVYSGDKCLALYVCSPTGVKPPHVTVYCPSDSLSQAKTEIDAAIEILNSVGINDGVPLCTETCTNIEHVKQEEHLH